MLDQIVTLDVSIQNLKKMKQTVLEGICRLFTLVCWKMSVQLVLEPTQHTEPFPTKLITIFRRKLLNHLWFQILWVLLIDLVQCLVLLTRDMANMSGPYCCRFSYLICNKCKAALLQCGTSILYHVWEFS